MRISTNMIYSLGTTRISELQSTLTKTQQQLSQQKRILTPADDPVASATMLGIQQSMSINDQFATNRQNAKNLLSQQESVLQSVTSLLQDAKTLVVTAGNGAMEDSQRQYLAAELRGRFEELMGLANSRDGAGNFMFGGYQIASQPYSETPTGAQYNGDQGFRMLQIGSSRQIALNDPGSTVFDGNKTGNGTFLAAAAPTNTGSGIVGTGAVINSAALTGNSYSVDFTTGAGGATTYTVQNTTTGMYLDPTSGLFNIPGPLPLPAVANAPYVSGQAITFDGMQIDVKGAPANNDKFTVAPSTKQSIFTTFNQLLQTLNASGAGASGQAKLTNGLNAANNNIDNALDNLLEIRAGVGTRLKEIEVLDSAGEDINVQYTDALNQLDNFDLAKTISDFTMQQITLEAAQKSFGQVARLSLFNYI
jgi:flagellar hook-associated protein 3 FlgL